MRTTIVLIILCFGLSAQVDKIKVKKETAEKPKCTATLVGMPSGTISVSVLSMVNKMEVSNTCGYFITGFVFYFAIDGHLKEIRSTEKELLGAISVIIRSRKPGDRFSIERITAKSAVTGQEFTLPDLNFKVAP
ncbi:MAG: hypothetical protein ACXVPQ_03795 [Bacteroidia bacterium]